MKFTKEQKLAMAREHVDEHVPLYQLYDGQLYQWVIKLREQGLSYTEIAKVLDMPLGSVKATVFRLRNRQQVPCVQCVECGKLYPAESNSLFCCTKCRDKWMMENK